MFTVFIAAADEHRAAMADMIRKNEWGILAGTAGDAKTALDQCAQNHPGVLILDDALVLAGSREVMDVCAQAPYPIVLFADLNGPAVAKRALAMGAKDLLDKSSWPDELSLTLERVATRLAGDRPPGKVISIFSSKGGVGKTTLSINLAMALAQKTHDPVIIVDLDLAFGDVSSMVACTPNATIHDLVNQPLDGPAVMLAATEVASNLYILPSPLNPEEAEDIQSESLVTLFQVLKDTFRYIVVDLAPGYNEITVTALDLSSIILTICTPDVVTLRTVGQSLRLFYDGFHYGPDKVRLVLNRSDSKTGITVADVRAILKSRVAFELPSEGSLPARAANEGIPFIAIDPRCALATAVYAMAATLIQEDVGRRGKRRSRESWLGRLTARRR